MHAATMIMAAYNIIRYFLALISQAVVNQNMPSMIRIVANQKEVHNNKVQAKSKM
jgi:hypothetical protein